MKKQLFYTLDEAAEILHLKTTASVVKYGKEGRILVIGEKRNLLVSIASVEAYAEGRSAWHARQQSHDAKPEPAVLGTDQSGKGRSRHVSRTPIIRLDTSPFNPERRRRRG